MGNKRDRPRELALRTLVNLDKKQCYSGDYIDELFDLHRGISERDRAFISNLVQGVVRWKLRLDWIIGQFSKVPVRKIDRTVLNVLRLAIFQILFLDRVPESAAVDNAVEQTRIQKRHHHIVSYVNGILRNICRNKKSITFPCRSKAPAEYLSSFYSFPPWLAERCIRESGLETAEKLFNAQNTFPPLNIRTNRLKTSREELLKKLGDEGIDAVPADYVPECIILRNFSGRIEKLSSFRTGLFQVQDQAAQAVSWLLNPQPGQAVLDVCAGLGGKSTHLQEIMKGKGTVTALDKDERRLQRLEDNAVRLGTAGITAAVADASSPLMPVLKQTYERVLIDAPCSGLGTVGRHPDIKWNRTEADIKRMAGIQRRILEISAEVTKVHGLLLYVVCTYSREENTDVVENFLGKRNDFSLVDLRQHAPEWSANLVDNDGFFRSYPHRHNMDGFFAALLRREK